jgi:GTP-binding protein
MLTRTVAIVGRPNVGKSALFNRLAGRRISIVHDMPGVTRDRISAKCKLGNEPFDILDTGGIGSEVDASFTEQVHAEVEIALTAADLLLFVVDGQDGLTPVDQELARRLRKIDKPLILVVNKIDHDKHTAHAAEFARLGFKAQLSISAEHNLGIAPLVAWIERELPGYGHSPDAAPAADAPLKIAIVGRPNVGKSSLTNAILNDQRTMVSPISGTTRDAIDIPYERHGHQYILIDTAGIRPRGKVDNSVEVFSVMRSEASIRRSDICCLVIDATMGVTAQDKKIAGMIQEASRPCVIAVNKWDLIKERTAGKEALKEVLEDLRAELFFLDYAPLMLVSAKTGAELTRLFKSFENIHRGARARIGTGVLNRLVQTAVTQHPPPSVSGRRLKILFATQPEPERPGAIPIPEIVLFVNDDKLLVQNYRRHLESKIREHTPYTGLPLKLHLRAREPKKKA